MINKNIYIINLQLFFVFIFIVSAVDIKSVEAKSKGVDLIKKEPSYFSLPQYQDEINLLEDQIKNAETEAEKKYYEEQIKQYDDEYEKWLIEHNNPEKEEMVRKKQNLLADYRGKEGGTVEAKNKLQKKLPITQTGYDIISQSLEVCIDPNYFSDKEIKGYIKQIREIVGEEIDLTISPAPYAQFNACSSATSICDPMVSGITVKLTQVNCTLGFKAKFGSQKGFTTAGHCLDKSDGQLNKDVGQPSLNDLVGKTRLKYFIHNSNADCGFIENTSIRNVEPKVLLFDATLGTIDGVANPALIDTRDRLELFGATSGISKAPVVDLHKNIDFKAIDPLTGGIFFFTIKDLIQVYRMSPAQGDSGGAGIKNDTKLAGFLVGTGKNSFGRTVTAFFMYAHVFNQKFGPAFSWDFSSN